MGERTEDLELEADRLEVGVGGLTAELDLEPVEDQPVLDLLGLPHGVELPVDLRRVGEHRGELEDVAVDLELDAGHVVEDVAEPRFELAWVAHGEVDRVEADRRVLVGQLRDVLGQPKFGRRGIST